MVKNNSIQPVFDRVLLRDIGETQSESGIIIPKSFEDRSNIMEVVAVGTECKSVDVGDRVIIAKYSGTAVRVGVEVLTIVCEYDILGKFTKEEKTA